MSPVLRRRRAVSLGVIGLVLAGCTVGPDYQKPTAEAPGGFKESQGWKPAEPADTIPRGAWWQVFGDADLDRLEARVAVSNPTLKADAAAYLQAQAVAAEASAGLFPTVTATGGITASGGGGGASSGSSRSGSLRLGGYNQTNYSLSGGLSWDADLWGRIRRTIESDVASAQASAADLADATLSAQAGLATDYIDLRVQDELIQLLSDTVNAYKRSSDITRNKYDSGTAARSDVITAETQWESAQSQLIAAKVARAQYEHAIAIAIGLAPADFTLPPATLSARIPVVPAGLPSGLLERRPDVAAAERTVAAAHARIGVAIAAYYPDLTLSASYGATADALSRLVQTASRVWSVGPSLSETVYDGGLRDAEVVAARALYDQTLAQYRQTVLTSFQQVEDQLAALHWLQDQEVVERRTVESAKLAVVLALNNYKAGTSDYTTVVTAQETELAEAQTLLGIRKSRLMAAISLIQALGGGWESGDLPSAAAAGTLP